MAQKPGHEFGKRKPPATTEAAPVSKRSGQVALVLMGALAVGGGAYALMPSEKCDPNDPTLTSEQRTACQSRRSSSSSGGHGYYGGSSRSSYYGGDSSSHASSTGNSSSNIGIGHTTRGGFGSFGHSIAAHFSGGG